MKLQSLQLKQFADTKRWKVLQKEGTKSQLLFRFGHLNPEVHIDPVKGQPNKVLKQKKRDNIVETTSTVGLSTKKGSMTDFYESMLVAVKAGYLPGFTVAKIEKLRRDMNKQMPEECDFWTDVTITKYSNKKAALQTFKNFTAQFTKGFVNVPIPGMNDKTFKDTLKDPKVRKFAKAYGATDTQLDEVLKQSTQASKQLVKQMSKIDLKYKEGDFHGYDAIYLFPPSHQKPKTRSKRKAKFIKIKRPDGSVGKIIPGGGSDTRIKLPPNAFKEEDFPVNGRVLQTIRVKSCMITGGLLNSLNYIPSGKSFCHSLTKFKTNTETTREGDMTFIDHFIVPVNSNLKKEGYLNREETTDMILKMISLL